MKKRIIQLILALCMLLALLTMNVMAAEPDLTVDKDGNKYFVIVKNSPSTDFHICTAYYDENGRFMEMKEWAKNLGGIHPTLPEGVAYVKAFLWGANTYVPLCEAKELSFLPVYVAANFYDGDNLIDTKTVTLDETYGELPTPTREGYEFLGWYTAAEGGERVTASTKVTAETEISLYAHWRKVKFQISLYDGETLIETRTVNRGEAYGELPVLTGEDKAIFLGWFTAAEGGEQVTASTKATGENDIVLHAHWREQNIAVSFYDGETLIETRTVNYGEPYGELPVLTGEDESEFLGWFTAAEGGERVTAETAVTADSEVFLFARWKNLKKIPASIFDFDAAEVATFAYDKDGKPKARSATYTYTCETGETYTKSQFEIKYKRQGSAEYEAGNPGNAGTYDVTITRPADDTYAAFEHTYEGVLVINKGTHSDSFVKVMIADRGYTWFEFEVAKFGQWQYGDFSREEATITYYVSPDKVKVYQSEPGSNKVRLPEHLGADYNVCVEITNDPNWEDWNSGWLLEYYLNYTDSTKVRYNLMPYPTQSWREAGRYDTGWYSSDSTEFVITTPEQLAGLAYMVNNGGNSFAGKTVKLGNDINLIGYVWEPIGNGSTQFQGTFDGQNHSITGLYMSGNASYTGLFGYTSGSSSAYVEIKNLKLDDSDISGVHKANYAGGIVGLAKRTRLVNCISYAAVSCNKEGSAVGGIAGAAENVEIFDCINYGYLAGMGNVGGIAGKTSAAATISSCINRGIVTSAMNACGGIVGRSTGSTQVANCINDGEVSTTNNSEDFGGIVGLVESGKIYNCANHGYVKAYRCVGGIVGRNLIDGQIYNCYSGITGNYLHVYGTATSQFYVGAIVGRNQKDEGSVDACYYLLSSAKNYNGFVDGAGTKTGSTNNVPNLDIGYYHGWTTNVEGYWYGYNGGDSSTKAPLIELLNRWQNDHAYGGYILANWWVGTVEGYPLPNLTIW